MRSDRIAPAVRVVRVRVPQVLQANAGPVGPRPCAYADSGAGRGCGSRVRGMAGHSLQPGDSRSPVCGIGRLQPQRGRLRL